MLDFEKVISSPEVIKEYKKAFLLNMFQKLCVMMSKNASTKKRIHNLYLQSFDKNTTTQLIVKSEFDYDISKDEAEMFCLWVMAFFRKSNTRKSFSLEFKRYLYEKQHGKCATCGEKLGLVWSKIHVDHIIPFKLVGDELKDNCQALCDTCNECKSARTDYIFKSMLKLN